VQGPDFWPTPYTYTQFLGLSITVMIHVMIKLMFNADNEDSHYSTLLNNVPSIFIVNYDEHRPPYIAHIQLL
jgi:hypothetical protein